MKIQCTFIKLSRDRQSSSISCSKKNKNKSFLSVNIKSCGLVSNAILVCISKNACAVTHIELYLSMFCVSFYER